MLRELRVVSEEYEQRALVDTREVADPRLFSVHIHGALDPFSRAGCQEFNCRAARADRLARSVGLIADQVWLTDLVTERFTERGRVTNLALDEILSDVLIMARLWPLIQAGIIRFRSPWIASCADCFEKFNQGVDRVADDLLSAFIKHFDFERLAGSGYRMIVNECFEEPISFINDVHVGRVPRRRLAQYFIHEEVRSALWIAREASISRGALFSNSRFGLSGLLQADRSVFGRSLALDAYDGSRSFEVPWVSELDSSQVLELRDLASNALPQFREKMLASLCASRDSGSSSDAEIIAGLREDAARVRSELKVIQRSSAKYWKTTYMLLGVGLSAYGLAVDNPVAGVGGLLPLIQMLIQHKAGHEKDLATTCAKPAYVLVKAQDILAHASQ
jgi:hypothetical protein